MLTFVKQQFFTDHYAELKKNINNNSFDLNKTYKGKTLLQIAVSQGNLKFIKTLLARGAELDLTDKKGHTALHLAVSKGKLDCVKALLAHGADIGVTDKKGNTALHLAAKKGYFNIAEEMLGISIAAEKRTTHCPKKRKLAILEESQRNALQLLKLKNNKGDTPLHLAARLKNERTYKKLINLQPGYKKQQLDDVLLIRKKRFKHTRFKAFLFALFDVVRPSVSMNKLLESFAYVGLLAGTTAAIGIAFNLVFAALASVGLGMIVFASYKKNQAEHKAQRKFEQCQMDLAYLNNIRARLEEIHKLSQQRELNNAEINELQTMKLALNKENKHPKIKGKATNAKDYVSRREVIYTVVSGLGSFLCAYSGLLGLMGLSLAITSAVTGIGIGALLVSAGAVGVTVVLAVGLILALGLAVYRFRQLQPQFLVFGEMRMQLSDQRKLICTTQQSLQTSLGLIDELIRGELPADDSEIDDLDDLIVGDNITIIKKQQDTAFGSKGNRNRNRLFSQSVELESNEPEYNSPFSINNENGA